MVITVVLLPSGSWTEMRTRVRLPDVRVSEAIIFASKKDIWVFPALFFSTFEMIRVVRGVTTIRINKTKIMEKNKLSRAINR